MPSTPEPFVDTAPSVADDVQTTTCYMCACRCGIRVYLRDGQVRYIEGNPDHPVNHGVLCAKGAAGIMQHYSPARLTQPLKRIGPRGSGEFVAISWDEALTLATEWLAPLRARDPKQLAFFTGRDQSQSFTGWWAQQFGTVNYAAHGGFCSVNMAAAGLYSIGGSFWEFGEPDWEHTRYLLMFGVAEDHASNPIKRGLGQLKSRPGTKCVAINPVRTGYAAVADEWLGIRPGTDGLLIAALIHELLRAERIDWDYLVRYTNAGWLVIDAPGAADDGLFARDAEGRPLCFDLRTSSSGDALAAGSTPALVGARTLADGRSARPVFELLAARFLDAAYAPAAVADATGIAAETIARLAAEIASAALDSDFAIEQPWTDWAGRRHARMVGRPFSIHAMRGIAAHANGFHTCRLLHVLQMLLGAIDAPGSFRYKPPFPKHVPPAGTPATPGDPGLPLTRMPLGFPRGPGYLAVAADGTPQRLDKAFSWEHPLALHGMLQSVLHNAWAGDPYRIDTLFLYMANMAWNSAMNVPGTLRYLTDREADGSYRIPHVVYSDAYYSEMVAYADLVLPDTTYLERWDCISLLDRPISDADGAADAIRQPLLAPGRDVRPFQDVLLELGARLDLPNMTTEDGAPRYPGGYADYLVHHVRGKQQGPLAGWRGADGADSLVGAANPDQLERYVANGCFWREPLPESARYYKFANRDYLDYAERAGWIGSTQPVVLELYSEILQEFRLAAAGHGEHQPPDALRARLAQHFDPVPAWHAVEARHSEQDYPLYAVTQRPMHMYHSWGSQNAWLRQITSRNHLYVHDTLAERLALADDDWVWIVSPQGRVKAPIKRMQGVHPETVWTWNAIGKRRGAWGLDDAAPEATLGFLLNHLIPDMHAPDEHGRVHANADPVTGQAAWFDLRVRLEKCTAQEAGATAPEFHDVRGTHGPRGGHGPLRYGAALKGAPTGRHVAAQEVIGIHRGDGHDA
ncbi:MAG: molybdopterin oxidoreductase family protein [Gammaproteobacteria bacterium]|nr:molybdopterin oxidoreductase family protein [Gammaproteobacteria bacterium]MBI5616037.1 molybdopterin oxidoreductase family protein [Gammaproteobacteria bacterium]